MSKAEINQEVFNRLEKSGAVNHISALLFSSMAHEANNLEAQYVEGTCLTARPFVTLTETDKMAARLVFEYLSEKKLLFTLASLKSETQDNVCFSTKTPVSVKELEVEDDESKIGQLVEIRTAKPVRRRMKAPKKKLIMSPREKMVNSSGLDGVRKEAKDLINDESTEKKTSRRKKGSKK